MTDLYLPFEFRRSRWWRAYARLRRSSDVDRGVTDDDERAWARLARALVSAGAASFADAVAEALVTAETPLGRVQTGQLAGSLPSGLRALLLRDADTLASAVRFVGGREAPGTGRDLPLLDALGPPHADAGVRALAEALEAGDAGAVLDLYLEELRTRGGGPAALNAALAWDGAALRTVRHPDAADWGALFGLDSQLDRLAANTSALIAGLPAHDVLLYGARGSGKSTAVRGLLTRFAGSGLRLIEARAGALAGMPELLERLRNKPQAFVLYVDDLSFEADDPAYRPLRTLLEGGLSARPPNVAVYATSNRRHLLSERFSDRPAPEEEDVSRWDTQHERLALADRFGLVITFPDATQRRYLQLVRRLAEHHGVAGAADDESALRYAEWGNGYSGRTARQFVDTLKQVGTLSD